MKKISFSLFVLSLAAISCAQNVSTDKIPAIVLNVFQQQFPKANDVEWEMKGSLYEVEFETGLAGRDHKMLIDTLGNMVYHKCEIAESELPDTVRNSIRAQFPAYRISDVERIEDKGVVTYKAEFKKEHEEWEVIFSTDGKILEKKED